MVEPAAWGIIAVLGFLLSAWAVYDAHQDYARARNAERYGWSKREAEDLRKIAFTEVKQETITLIIMIVALNAGVAFVVPALRLRPFVVYLVISILALVVLKTLLRRLDRRAFFRDVGLRDRDSV